MNEKLEFKKNNQPQPKKDPVHDISMDEVLTMSKPKKFENYKHIVKDDVDEPVKKKRDLEPTIVPPPPVKPVKEDQHRSIRAKMIEEEMSKPRGFRNRKDSSSGRGICSTAVERLLHKGKMSDFEMTAMALFRSSYLTQATLRLC